MPALRSFVVLLIWSSFVPAADWPQWRGPDRAAVVTDFTAPTTWPKDLQKKWSVFVGEGAATPALVGDRLYAFGYQDGKEVLRCLDAGTGKELWKDQYEARPAGGPARGFPAARSSPAVAEGKVVTLGVQGTLSCLDARTGALVWRKDGTGGVPGFSAASSPLLADGLCVAQVGGDRGGAVVAYELADGKEKWKWASDGTKYASPMLLTQNDLKAVVAETAGTISALNLADGGLLWSTKFSTHYNASTPVVEGQVIYYAGSGRPTTAVRLEKRDGKVTGKELWTNDDASVIFSTPVVRDGLMFGLSERNEVFCIDTKTGKRLWSQRLEGGGGGGRGRSGYGSLVAAGPVLFSLTPAAELAVFEPDRDGLKRVAGYKVADGSTYAYPVVTGEGVYVRDRDSVTFWTFK